MLGQVNENKMMGLVIELSLSYISIYLCISNYKYHHRAHYHIAQP